MSVKKCGGGRKQKNPHYPSASEASREVANLTERKNTHTPIFFPRSTVAQNDSVTNLKKNIKNYVLSGVEQLLDGYQPLLEHLYMLVDTLRCEFFHFPHFFLNPDFYQPAVCAAAVCWSKYTTNSLSLDWDSPISTITVSLFADIIIKKSLSRTKIAVIQ